MYYSKGQKLLSAIILAVLFTCGLLTEGIAWFTTNYWNPISAEFGGEVRFHNPNIVTTDDGLLTLSSTMGIPGGRYGDVCICQREPDLFGELMLALLLPSPPMNSGETLTDTVRGNMEALAEVAADVGELVPDSFNEQHDEHDEDPEPD